MTHQRSRARGRRAAKRARRPWLPITAGVVVSIGVVAIILVMELRGDSGAGSTSNDERAGFSASATPTPPADARLASRAGGLTEGAIVPPASPPTPPASELRENGGRRFALPLRAHAGVEDYFGTPRLYGQVHGGVDFSLAGLDDVPVFAACDGVVAAVDESATLGSHVIVDCGDDWAFVAGFLASAEARGGMPVDTAAVIGKGTPGGHLHVELRFGGVQVDPAGYMDLPRRVILPTPTPTNTPGPTRTALPAASTATRPAAPAGATPTPPGPTSTPTATPTITNTPTITPTPTWTPTPSPTPRRPTATPPPLPRAQ